MFEILGCFIKWALRNQRAEKWLNNGDFQVVGSLFSTSVKIQEKVGIYSCGFGTIINSVFLGLFKLGGRVVK